MPDRPNVIVFLPDQHRGMATSPAGNPDVQTPTLERLAEEGVRCPNAYANVPVCTPSRGSLLTGQFPHNHGAVSNDMPLGTDARTVGGAFRDAGYRTAYVGKWHLDGVPREKYTPPGPRRHGFDHWAAYNCHLDFFGGHYYRDEPDPEQFEEYEPIALTDLALEFLDAQRGDADPFFLVVSPHPPHGPYEDVPDRYRERYDADDLSLRPNAEPGADAPSGERADRTETLANYYAHVTAVDEQVGRVLDWLDDAGASEDTAVLYTSDHGDMLSSHGVQSKCRPHEESISVPFFCRYPGVIPSGTVVDSLVGTVDVAPTLCSLAGVDDLPEADGTDLAPALRGADVDTPSSVFIGIPKAFPHAPTPDREWRGVRTDRYTYARWADGSPWVLFDNEADPCQQENLVQADDAADLLERPDGEVDNVADLLDELDGEVDRWIERTGDPNGSGEHLLWELDLVETWNDRERVRNPEHPDLID